MSESVVDLRYMRYSRYITSRFFVLQGPPGRPLDPFGSNDIGTLRSPEPPYK